MAEEKTTKNFDWQRFVKVQQSLPNVGKDGKGNYGSYMKLEDLNPALLKVLNDNGFVWVTMPTVEGDKHCLSYTIVDTISGASIGGVMDLLMAQSTPQAQGSAITYARRYALTAMTGLVADMDDDGQKATDDKTKENKTNVEIIESITKTKTKDEVKLIFDSLTPGEKKVALPAIQEKLRELENV